MSYLSKFTQKLIHRAVQLPRVLKYRLLSDNEVVDGSPRIVQPGLFLGKGKILLGECVTIGYRLSPFFIAAILILKRGILIRASELQTMFG